MSPQLSSGLELLHWVSLCECLCGPAEMCCVTDKNVEWGGAHGW